MLLDHLLEVCESFGKLSPECREQVRSFVYAKRLKITVAPESVDCDMLPFLDKVRWAADQADDYHLKAEAFAIIRKLEKWLDKNDPWIKVTFHDFMDRCPVANQVIEQLNQSNPDYEFSFALESPEEFRLAFCSEKSPDAPDVLVRIVRTQGGWGFSQQPMPRPALSPS